MKTFLISFLALIPCILTWGQRKMITLEGIPKGNYAVSVVETDFCDTTTIKNAIYPISASELDSLRKACNIVFKYETEQVISGRIKGTWGKVKKPQLHIFIPQNSFLQKYDMEGRQIFNITGLDFFNGTEFVLQATKPSGSDKFIQIQVDKPYFPNISTSAFLSIDNSSDTLKTRLQEYTHQDVQKEMLLPDVVVKGKRIRPLNMYKLTPSLGIAANDSIFRIAKTMSALFAHLGLQTRNVKMGGYNILAPTKTVMVFRGTIGMALPVPPTIWIDDVRADFHDIQDLMNMDPKMIKQIEYFTREQSEATFTFKKNEAGALVIYTYPWAKNNNSLSMVSVKPLGYQPARYYNNNTNHNATVYWNPTVKVDSDGIAEIIFDAKPNRKYTIKLEGVSDNGELISIQQ